jgi:hypothetical protein
MNNDRAYLSNDKDMIKFQYGEKIIRFRGPYSLERFTSVKEWDNGGNGEISTQQKVGRRIYRFNSDFKGFIY